MAATAIAVAALLALAPAATAAAPESGTPSHDTPLWRATHGVLLAIARAGHRLVAVGDRGTVLLSDDDGAGWRLASADTGLLTAVLFTDDTHGVAVGQDAAVVTTDDGGTHWTRRFGKPGSDQALFAVASMAPAHVVAVGAYNLLVETLDGTHWTAGTIPGLDEDFHLNCVVARGADLFVAGEGGHDFLRRDGKWTAIAVPYDGSQFGCLAAPDGTLYSFGLRGSLFARAAGAGAWRKFDGGDRVSLFGGTLLADGRLALVGANGVLLLIDPAHGGTVRVPTDTTASLSGIVETAPGHVVVVGDDGVHRVDLTAAASPVARP